TAGPVPRLGPSVRYHRPVCTLGDLVLPPDQRDRLRNIIQEQSAPALIYLRGSNGSGRRSVAGACCRALECALVVVDGESILKTELDVFEKTVANQRLVHRTPSRWLHREDRTACLGGVLLPGNGL